MTHDPKISVELDVDDVVRRILDNEQMAKIFKERVGHAAWSASHEATKELLQEKNWVTFNVMADEAVKDIAEDYFKECFDTVFKQRIGGLVQMAVRDAIATHVEAAMKALTMESP